MNNRFSKKLFLIAFLISLLFIHLPLGTILFFTDFDGKKLSDILVVNDESKKALEVVQVKLPLIDMEKPKQQEVPEKYSAVSKYDVKTKEETVSVGGPAPETTVVKVEKAQPKPKQKSQPKKKTESQTAKETKSKSINSESKSSSQAPNNLQETLASLEKKQKQQEQDLQKLFEAEDPDYKVSFSRGGDYLPYYKVGNRTYVNAIAHPDVSYYAELKRKFRYAWDPFPALRGKSHMFSNGAIQVVWGFTLNREGQIIDMQLIKASPNGNYDYEAKRTIRVSSPFSAPPKHLLNEQNVLHIAWAFVVYF